MRFVDVTRVRSRFDEPIVAADGVRLSADVYLPPEPGRYPALITRTPYDNNHGTPAGPGAATPAPSPADRFKQLAAHGFVVVACDVRGMGDSEGVFEAFEHEARDGREAVEWVRELPECDGRVGLFGAGYAGFAALAAATETRVDAVVVWSPFDVEGTPFRGGALRLDWLFWLHLTAGRTPQPVDVPRWADVFRHRPIATMPEALGRDDVPWAEWLDGPAGLRSLDLGERLAALAAPTLFVTGWWDSGLRGTLRQWEAAGAHAAHALTVGPWDTQAVRRPRADVGGVPWGPSAVVDPDELLLEWFSGHLGGGEPPPRGARVFVTGRNEWSELDPGGRPAETATWWLASNGAANTRRGDGRLVPTAEAGPPDRFVHDPDRPVRWQPALGTFSRSKTGDMVLDTSFATSRDDVLVYDAPVVSSPALVCGRPVAHLWVRSDAHDSDWVVALEDVFPGGTRSVHLAHGIVRVGSLGAEVGPEPLALTIQLSPIAHELLPGHSLRLLVASSLWPLYAVNLGGGDYLHDVTAHVSEHAVLHDEQHPSRLTVPLASGPDRKEDVPA